MIANLKEFVGRMVIRGHSDPTRPIGVGFSQNKMDHPYNYDDIQVFSKTCPVEHFGTESVYTDRLLQWDYKKYNECCQKVWGNQGQYFDQRSAEDISKFLSLYFDRKVEVFLINECCNAATGYPLWYFQFAYMEKKHEVQVQ